MVASAASTEQICECGDWTCTGNHTPAPEPPPEPHQEEIDAEVVRGMAAYADDARRATSLEGLRDALTGHAFLWAEYRRTHDDRQVADLARDTPAIVVDPEQLPRFGGDRPEGAGDCVSWDAVRVLVRTEWGLRIVPRSARPGDELMARARAVGESRTLEELRERLIALDQSKREAADFYRGHGEWLGTQDWYTHVDLAVRLCLFAGGPYWWREDLPAHVRVMGCDGARILVRTADRLEILPVPERPSLAMRVVRRLWPRSRNAFRSLRA